MKIAILINDITGIGGVERVVTNTSNYFIRNLGWNINIISLFEKTNKNINFELDSNAKVVFSNI